MDFSIANFNGPLPLLLYLVQKQEMDVCDVLLKELTTQFLAHSSPAETIDFKAEFLSILSWLILLKSRRLLPTEQGVAEIEEEGVIRLELFQKLLEYTTFKEIAETLLKKEEEESAFFARNPPPFEKTPSSGLEEVEIQDLATILQDLLENVQKREPKLITLEEEWDVPAVLADLKLSLCETEELLFRDIFTETKTRGELIAHFLALLELMKQQFVSLVKRESEIWILKKPSP